MRPSDLSLRDLVECAVHAPSVLNTQPWRFALDDGAVRLYADRSRQLRALDPQGRDLVVSCGAALFYLRTAARHAGWAPLAEVLPDRDDPDLLAVVRFVPEPSHADDRLFRALSARHTNRHPFADAAVPAEAVRAMVDAASGEGARLHLLTGWEDRAAVAHLVSEGATVQSHDPAVSDDLRAWLRADADPRPDGVRDLLQGEWDRKTTLRTPVSAFASNKGDLVRAAPAIGVVTTEGDGPADWLAAGQALAHGLVVAAGLGLSASFANEPVEVEGLRGRLAARLGPGYPQVAFRLGYPSPEGGAPRRPAHAVIDDAR
jgi:hypothetical protein